MSIRRFNYTGRARILREDARVIVRTDAEGRLEFDAAINLVDYELPPDAHVFLEAYRQTSFMRFAHGTVANPQPPPEAPRRLSEFGSKEGLLFRVKITSAGDPPGLLLAEADRIPISDDEEEPDRRLPLLPPAPDDLGSEVWRIDFRGASRPFLLINNRVGDWKDVASSARFRCLIYPEAMRAVLLHVHFVEQTDHMDDLTDWRCQWLKFASSLPGVGNPPLGNDDAAEWVDWINDAVAAFSRQHQFNDQLRRLIADEATT